MIFETHRIKVIVAILSICVAVDGLLKVSANATMFYYFQATKFGAYLICRIIIGALLAIWAYFGLGVLFYDYTFGLTLYSVGILGLTIIDISTLTYKLLIHKSAWYNFFNTDEFATQSLRASDIVFDGLNKHDILGMVLCFVFLLCQIIIFFFGLVLSCKLRKHQADEAKYIRNLARLTELRRENQKAGKPYKELLVQVTALR